MNPTPSIQPAAELHAIVTRVHILGPGQFLIDGVQSIVPAHLAPSNQTQMFQPFAQPVPSALALLTQHLAQTLYTRAYTFSLDQSPPTEHPLTGGSDIQNLAAQLQASAPERHTPWDPGWTVYAHQADGGLSIRKGPCHRSAAPTELLKESTGQPPNAHQPTPVGSTVSLHIPADSFHHQPGFYHRFGIVPGDQIDDRDLVRLYLHTDSSTVVPLLLALCPRLDRQRIPFRLKTLLQTVSPTRADTTVLYIARRHFRPATLALRDALEELSSNGLSLHPRVPLFSKAITPGVGVAEDPGGNESFGTHRCALLARGMVLAWQHQHLHPEQQLHHIASVMQQAGVDPQRPWLVHPRPDLYEFPTDLALAV